MKMWERIKIGATCLGVVAAMCVMSAAWAQPAPGPGGEEGPEGPKGQGRKHFEQMMEKLHLSSEQQAQLDANRERHKGEMEALRKQMSAKRKELSAALEQQSLDINKVKQVHNELKELILKREDQLLGTILEIRSILTPEQFAQFQAMGMHGRRHGPPNMPPGPPPPEDAR